MSRAIDTAGNDSRRYLHPGVINKLINAWLFRPWFAVISIWKRSGVANVAPALKRTPIRQFCSLEGKVEHCSRSTPPCYLFTSRNENGWRPLACNTVFVSRFMVKPARIYVHVMLEPEGRAKNGASSGVKSRENYASWGVVIVIGFGHRHRTSAGTFENRTSVIFFNEANHNSSRRSPTSIAASHFRNVNWHGWILIFRRIARGLSSLQIATVYLNSSKLETVDTFQ